MTKFIDPATDFGFKRIFKDEEITRGFLNALMHREYPDVNIAKVTITDGEIDETSKETRRVVYDVHCETDTGEEFVIEMQNDSQNFFSERIVFYLSRAASRQQNKGYMTYADKSGKEGKTIKKAWDYHLKNIYGVFFMNFKDEAHPKKLSHFALMETKEHYIDTHVFQYWKIQMPFYREMKASDCKDDIDKWIFNLSNMSEMETSLSFTKEIPLFMRLEELASYSALSPAQQMQYDDSFHNYVSYHGQMQYKYDKGRAEGRAEGRVEGRAEGRKEGRAEGIAEGKIATARLMKADGEPAEKIARYTGLTIEEIQKL